MPLANASAPRDVDLAPGVLRGPGLLTAYLARLEATTALSALAARFPHARLAGEPQYKPNVTLRGLSALRVAV